MRVVTVLNPEGDKVATLCQGHVSTDEFNDNCGMAVTSDRLTFEYWEIDIMDDNKLTPSTEGAPRTAPFTVFRW